jgi:hypothetical protein
VKLSIEKHQHDLPPSYKPKQNAPPPRAIRMKNFITYQTIHPIAVVQRKALCASTFWTSYDIQHGLFLQD